MHTLTNLLSKSKERIMAMWIDYCMFWFCIKYGYGYNHNFFGFETVITAAPPGELRDRITSWAIQKKKLFDKDRLALLVHNYQLSVKYGFDSSFPQEPGFIEYLSVLFSLSFMRTKHFVLSKEWDIIWKIYSYKPCFIYFILYKDFSAFKMDWLQVPVSMLKPYFCPYM